MVLASSDLTQISHDYFVSQFIAGPEYVKQFESWQKIDAGENCKITAHPALSLTQSSCADGSLTLIGEILDPKFPLESNKTILDKLMSSAVDMEQLFDACSHMGGRWVLIISDQNKTVFFHDALGLRQVFYSTEKINGGYWVMSNPGIAEYLWNLNYSKEALDYVESLEFRTRPEYRWPGAATVFSQIRHLLPNHYFNLTTVQCKRYWPNRDLPHLSMDQGVDKIKSLFSGLVSAAMNRFNPMLGVTAGLDCRLVLAASRDLGVKLDTVTTRQGRMPDDHQDILTSKQLMTKFGLEHTVVLAQPYMSAEFSYRFKKQALLAHDHYGPDAEAILTKFGRTRAVITGSGSEIGRVPFNSRISRHKSVYTAQDLAMLQNMGSNQLAIDYFKQWLVSSEKRYNIHLLDLFSWEQSHGNWLAATQMEFDIAWREIITPYNCRALLEIFLSVDESYRCAPNYQLYKTLIEEMWPELLDVPINPHKQKKQHSCLGIGSLKHILARFQK